MSPQIKYEGTVCLTLLLASIAFSLDPTILGLRFGDEDPPPIPHLWMEGMAGVRAPAEPLGTHPVALDRGVMCRGHC